MAGHHRQVTGIKPDGSQSTFGELHSLTDGGFNVVGVHQQCRFHPQRVELCLEGGLLGIMEKGE